MTRFVIIKITKNHSSWLIYEIVYWFFTAPNGKTEATQKEENDPFKNSKYMLEEAEVNFK